MKLTIITINRNNTAGLGKTMQSVFSQTCKEFDYVVVDGASTDGSVDIISKYAFLFGHRMKWISEPDKGIYNAMNKGIGMASGEYVEFLNSGDYLAGPDVTGTLNHPPTFIRRDLFNKYGLYDENLKIVSDWKWFIQAIILGEEKPIYAEIDVAVFDMTGISETNQELNKCERRQVLAELFPQTILEDYNHWAFPIAQIKRLKRHPWAYKLVWFLERCLFKIEKRQVLKSRTVQYQ